MKNVDDGVEVSQRVGGAHLLPKRGLIAQHGE